MPLNDDGTCPICGVDRSEDEPHLDWCDYEGEEPEWED